MIGSVQKYETQAVLTKEQQVQEMLKKVQSDFLKRTNSDNTVEAYRRHLKEFMLFIGTEKNPFEVTENDVINFRDLLIKVKDQKASTVNAKLSTIRTFYEYLKANNFIQKNPAHTKLVPPPKMSSAPKGRALSNKEVRYLLYSPLRDSVIGARDYAIIHLMLRCFFRVSETVSLRQSDFSYQKGLWIADVKVKGGAEHRVPIPKEVKKAIDLYLELDREHRQELKKVHDLDKIYLFQSVMEKKKQYNENKALSRRHIWHVVKEYGEKAGIGKVTPHDLRRTAITASLNLKESYRRVKNGSRLKSIETVERYDHNRNAEQENSILSLNYED